ncbi:MAG TPA: penicillin acylase family protein [Actinomycetota bacterium]|nr:penicillin acylase family protein [Actinomycetota bacterium]
MRSRLAVVIAVLAVAFAMAGASAALGPVDLARAVNVVPPGESGLITLPQFLQAQINGNYGPHFADQAPLYASFRYKPDAFGKGTLWRTLPGATIYRDAWGVPQIYADSPVSLLRAMGYAMASDRLFQMEIFRRAGHGTLAALLGKAYIPMDEAVRQVSEGSAARMAEFNAADPLTQAEGVAFADGINTYINEAMLDPNKLPAEFVLLGDLPISPWTIDDSLAFGEYAGRFFGEFGHGELDTAASLAAMTKKVGAANARKIIDDLYPLNDPTAVTTIPRSLGIFPRHVGHPGSRSGTVVNETVAAMGGAAAISKAVAERDVIQATLRALQDKLGLVGFGSNEYVVDAKHTADHHPLLVSEPQTSLANPSFFWEVEMHGGGFDVRGVTVPGLPFVPIGRNARAAWAVTSALDANSDTFTEHLSADGKSYLHNGHYIPLQSHTETIACHTPPTAVLGLTSGDTSSVCTSPSVTITVSRTVHGPLITTPDVGARVAYSRESVVDGRIVSSLLAWTQATQAETVPAFQKAASGVAFGFNFMFVDTAGDAAYFHVGRYPIRPSDVDPRFPIPGTGPWDWQGFEKFSDQPHAIDPAQGYLANWNNKPAVGWISKPVASDTIPPAPNAAHTEMNAWTPIHQVQSIQLDLARLSPRVTFENMGSIEKDVSSLDNRARAYKSILLAAIDASHDPSLSQARTLLASWNDHRVDLNKDGSYDAPGLTIFDRWNEIVRRKAFTILDPLTFRTASGVRDDGHYFSSDNEDVPTFKTDLALDGTFYHLLHGTTRFNYFGSTPRNAVVISALKQALSELTAQYGSSMTSWHEADEHEPYPSQGAGAVADVVPTLNRGSYGQIVEPGAKPEFSILVAP